MRKRLSRIHIVLIVIVVAIVIVVLFVNLLGNKLFTAPALDSGGFKEGDKVEPEPHVSCPLDEIKCKEGIVKVVERKDYYGGYLLVDLSKAFDAYSEELKTKCDALKTKANEAVDECIKGSKEKCEILGCVPRDLGSDEGICEAVSCIHLNCIGLDLLINEYKKNSDGSCTIIRKSYGGCSPKTPSEIKCTVSDGEPEESFSCLETLEDSQPVA